MSVLKTIIRPVSSLKITAEFRKAGYLEACLSVGVVTGEGVNQMVEFTREQHARIRSEFALQATPPIDTSLPSFLQMAKNAAGAAARAVTAAVTGQPVFNTDEEILRRGAICAKCPFLRPEDGRCAKCGCGIQRWISKLSYAQEDCPDVPSRWKV